MLYKMWERRPTKEYIEALIKDKPEGISAKDWLGWDAKEISPEDWRAMWGTWDWEKPNNYPRKISRRQRRPKDYVELSQDQWRWEFLRRDADYRDAWVAHQNGEAKYDVGHGNKFRFLDNDECFRLDDKKYEYLCIFDLSCIIDPRLTWRDVPEEFFVRRNQGQRITKQGAFEIPKFLDSDRYEIFVFDTKRQIAEQTDRAKSRLKDIQKQKTAAQKQEPQENGAPTHRRGVGADNSDIIRNKRLSDNPDRLLRLLDAYSEGIADHVIAKEIFGLKDYKDQIKEVASSLNTALHMWEWL